VPVINGRQFLPDEPRHRLNDVALMHHRDRFGSDAKVHFAADQPARNRVRVGPHVDRAAARNTHALDDVVGVKPLVWQPVQMSNIFKKLLPTVVVGALHKFFDERNVLVAAGKITTATQH
jgi:hypothetical protein